MKKKNGVTGWLRRIFSMTTLEVTLMAISLYFAYYTFIRETPGELSLFTRYGNYEKDIRYVFYGFEIDGDTLHINEKSNFPTLANLSSNPVTDLTVISDMDNNLGYKTSIEYRHYIAEPEDDLLMSKLTMTYAADRIGFRGIVPFPLLSLETRNDEIFCQKIRLSYMYQGMSEDIINLHYILVGIPKQHRDDDGKRITPEYAFIKTIRPLICEIESPKEILLIFGNNIVEAPEKMRLLKEENIVVEHISDLK